MSSWDIEIKVSVAETGKKNGKYIKNCKYIHIGSFFVVHHLMLKKMVLLYTKNNSHMQKNFIGLST